MLAVFIPFYLAITLAIGFWASIRIKRSTDFTLAGRNLSTSFVGVTLFATWFGSSQIMGNPGRFVESGFSTFVTLTLASVICLLIVARFYAKRLYEMNIVTVGDFFGIRYDKRMDLTVSILMVLAYPHWIAAQFVALAFLFQSVFGVSFETGVFIGASIVVVYTYIGGMWAVSYTDMLQSILILLGLLILVISILDKTGGITPIFEGKDPAFFSLFPKNGLKAWSEYVATFAAFFIGTIPVQEVYQRVFSAKSSKAAVNGVYLSAFLLLLIPSIPLIIAQGSVYLHPELMEIGQGQNIIPMMVSKYADVSVQVLFYGALISAILSTSSGAMLAPATVIGENLIRPYIPSMGDKKLLLMTRISVIAVAVISCFLALIDADIVSLVMASVSLIMVSVFVPFTFGLFWKRSSTAGAWLAIISGALIWLVCYILETEIDPTLYGTGASAIAMVVGSLVKPNESKKL